MDRKIRMAVAVHNENGESTWYYPGDVPTAEHAALITNPKAWEGYGEPEPERQNAVSGVDPAKPARKPAPKE